MEFIVVGTPRSANAPNRSRRRWRERVARAARERLREEGRRAPIGGEIGVLIIYFHQGEATLDVDNIAKSLFDGLKDVVFRDDRRVSELRVRKKPLQRRLIVGRCKPTSVERDRAHVTDKLRFRVCAHRCSYSTEKLIR